MEYLGLNPKDRPTIENLRKIVQNFLEIVPFQNLTMHIGPMRRPTWNEICERCFVETEDFVPHETRF